MFEGNDVGIQGARDTMKALDESGIAYTGFGENYEDSRKDLVVTGNGDRVVVIYHGGKEHCRYPSPRLRRLAQAMARNGADVVLCQHSHCVGCYEQCADCHILYGQGNFHFVKPSFLDPDMAKTWNNSLAVKYDTMEN